MATDDAGRLKIPQLRWCIALMLFLAAVLNYLDRQTLSLLAPTVQADLGMTDADYSHVVNLFLIAYMLGYLFCGRVVDRLGVRAGMALFVTWWSISNMLTALATSVRSLGAVRFSLGLGEAGNWPGSAKAVGEWFPARERAFAVGFYTLGATIGATIAPILVLWLASKGGWQMPFVVIGALGLLWAPAWLWLYARPDRHPRLRQSERDYILAGQTTKPESPTAQPAGNAMHSPGSMESRSAQPAGGWMAAIRNRHVWALMVARFLTDPVWFFYQFWFAKYLFAQRGLSQGDLSVTWVVYLAADVGCLAGGLASGLLIRRGASPPSARLWTMFGCALVMPLSMCVPQCPALWQVLLVSIVIVLAHLAWLANLTALVIDRCPPHLVATCFGIVAAGSALGGIAMNEVVVYFAGRGDYARWFLLAGLLHPVAITLLFVSGAGRSARRPTLDNSGT